jgi:hypothetical protein
LTPNGGMPTISARTIIIKQEYEALLPKLSPAEFESLKQSIEEIGLQIPLIVNQYGILLDGHHRYRAWQELGFVQQPKILLREFNDPLLEKKFIIKLNRDRRHLTAFQRIEFEFELEGIENELAKKRMSTAGREGAGKRWTKKGSDNYHDGNANDDRVVKNYTPPKELNDADKALRSSPKGRVIDVSARNAHVSPMTYFKGREIIRNAPEEIKEKLRSDKLKINKAFQQLQRQRLKEELIKSSGKESKLELTITGTKLLLGDFIEKSKTVADNSIDLIFTDPPYGKQWLPLYEKLAGTAFRVLKYGGSLVTTLGQHLIPEVIGYMQEAGLNYHWILSVKLAGPFSRFHARNVVIMTKPLLWVIKGDKSNAVDYISDFIESTTPKKVVHDWEQSTVEAEHVISRLTVENQILFDPMMGSGTAGIAALKLNRKFIGIEIDKQRFEIAKMRINRSSNKPLLSEHNATGGMDKEDDAQNVPSDGSKNVIRLVEDFFSDISGQPLPEHNLEESPCHPIIEKDTLQTMGRIYYRCKLHPEVWNVDLRGIEHHCKYNEPDNHKTQILNLLSV